MQYIYELWKQNLTLQAQERLHWMDPGTWN